jgi:carbamoyltransferase
MRIVGVSPAHDSSVATYCDGNIELFFKEERLSRSKRDKQPFHSLRETSKYVSGPVDGVVISCPTPGEYSNTVLEASSKILKSSQCFDMSHLHHLSHAALAFYNSGFEEAAVIVVDRNGGVLKNVAREAETIFVARYPNEFIEIYKNYWVFNNGADASPTTNSIFREEKRNKPNCEIVHSSSFGITKVYETATSLIGQHILENGKTMGLSAYGQLEDLDKLFLSTGAANDSLFTHEYSEEYMETISVSSKLHKYANKNITIENYKLYANYAYKVQIETQRQVAMLIQKTIETTGINKICITGGYGLNVVANNYYTKTFPNVSFFFEPIADDSGNSIGSAMFVYRELTKDKKIYPIKDTFYHGIDYKLEKNLGTKCSFQEVAKILKSGHSVGVFYGKAEAGPRALGHRSILFDPRDNTAKEKVNRIKKREWYRPFAAAILLEDASKYFNLMGLKDSKYMTINFEATEEGQKTIPGVIHVDNTSRIQTVTEENKHIYELLKEFKKITKVGALLNTSFNLAGQPLVETPQEALDVLKNSLLDYVWFPEIERLVRKVDIK